MTNTLKDLIIIEKPRRERVQDLSGYAIADGSRGTRTSGFLVSKEVAQEMLKRSKAGSIIIEFVVTGNLDRVEDFE